jgi:hypothetical protein
MWGVLSDERKRLSFTVVAGFMSAVILYSESLGTNYHILVSHIRDSTNLEGQVPIFISPKKGVIQFYP